MYIHTYQIQNVLNAYRKQLSQNSVNSPAQRPAPQSGDRINISAEGQKTKLLDDISSQIIDRIAKFGPKSEFDEALADQLSRFNGENASRHAGKEAPVVDFTYTTIDERNQKSTSTLDIQQISPMNRPIEPPSAGAMRMAQLPNDELADDDDKDLLNG